MKILKLTYDTINFTQCKKEMDSDSLTDIWKSIHKIDGQKVEFEVINECLVCGTSDKRKINWNSVQSMLEHLPKNIKKLKTKSNENLLYLAKHMAFWKDDFLENHDFWLDAIEYTSPYVKDSQLEYNNFENHSFNLIFTLESKNGDSIDLYGRWITKWTGNQVTGIIREQY